MIELPKTIPIFPLGGALLLPSGNLPLNIFEPRYISMVDYALSNKKFIGMVQTKENSSNDLYQIGCLGKITSYSETEDSRYLINLKGISKFKILNEKNKIDHFRVFDVEYDKHHKNYFNYEKKLFNKEIFVEKIKQFLKNKNLETEISSLDKFEDKLLIVMIAMVCPFKINEKQALLESKNIKSLADTLISLFELSNSPDQESIN